jgi:outer membrane protein insertion porin family
MRNLLSLVILSVMLSPVFVRAEEAVRVVVLPFAVNAQEDLSYLRKDLPEALRKNLAEEGAEARLVEPAVQVDAADLAAVRQVGADHQATHVIWGSLTWIGQQFSVDARVMDAQGGDAPLSFAVEGSGIENLPAMVKKLAGNIGLAVFSRDKVVAIAVEGNKRIETDAIQQVVKTVVGTPYNPKKLADDLKAIYAMGFFDDVQVSSEKMPDGLKVIYTVKEKPTVRVILVKGNEVYNDDEIKEALTIKTGSILNIAKVQENLRRVEDLYKSKNYHNVQVSYQVLPLERNQADLEFSVVEGKKIRIKTIRFEGNSAYSEKQLKGQMKTSEEGFLSWLTSSGELNREDLNQDVTKLAAFYQNHGYIQAKVGEPQVDFKSDGIEVRIKIDEGPQFKVGKVDIQGELVLGRDQLQEKLKIRNETFFNREVLQSDVLALTDLYADEGYAYAEIVPRLDRDAAQRLVNITFDIKKGNLVYFEEIIITGNTKTRDKVIRRQLKVYENELYSGKDLKRSVRNLHRLDYFQDIKVDTVKGSADDKMVLKLDVTEKPTGQFSFGGGYSSVENAFVMAQISQRNLFGRGQILQLKGQLGSVSNRYTLSFTEPWLFDIPLSGGFDIYKWNYDYDQYEKDSWGGGLRTSYPVFDFTRVFAFYNYEVADVTDIDDDAPDSIKELDGTNVTSSVTGKIQYDSRDKVFNPTEGQDHSISVEYAGLGGDVGFTKTIGEVGWYVPLVWQTVGFIHARGGYVEENSSGFLPDYEKFRIGGINSMRGFEWEDLAPREVNSKGSLEPVGGEKFVQFNLEVIFPLVKEAGVMGVVFFDTGDVYSKDEDIEVGELRESAGGGIRWYSPIGPLRLEYGYILDPEKDRGEGGKWEFSVGAAF